ncbi:MAG TPA: hypothetical protein VHV82_19190 [Sporichthyaceae bacterium]|nr:hypothetical protein [Sporichthyaceae bacterium]
MTAPRSTPATHVPGKGTAPRNTPAAHRPGKGTPLGREPVGPYLHLSA